MLCLLAIVLLTGCQEKAEETTTEPDGPPPASVSVGVTHTRPPELNFDVDGRAVEVDDFVVVFGVTELHLCERAGLGFELIPSARAHVPSTGTRLGTVFAEDLTTETDAAQIVGDFEPLEGTYCSATLVAAPADDDVLNTSPVPSDALFGKSLFITGTVDGEPFEWTTAQPVIATIALDREELGPGASLQLLFHKRVDEQLFEGIFELDSDTDRARVVLERLMTNVKRWSG